MNGSLVDTNVLSELTKPNPEPKIGRLLAGFRTAEVYISVISLGEIAKGIALLSPSRRRDDLQRWLDTVLRPSLGSKALPVTGSIAERWGLLTAEAKQKGRAISMADGLILATAIEHRLSIVTRNIKDFTGFHVHVLDPWTA